MKRGFTLVELVVVMGLFALLGVMVTAMLVATLQSAKKAAAVALVKNEGTYVINTMTQMLKFSSDVECGSPPDWVEFHPRKDGSGLAKFLCDADHIASNGASLTSDKVEMTTCKIECDLDIKYVDVSFDLRVKNAGFVTERGGVTFNTRINLRNRE